jgi:hydantoinase/carbamoylase family amidase
MTAALHDAIAELATFNDDPDAGGITREVFTPTYERSVEFVSGLMRDAGLDVRRDAFGNLYGRLEGTDPSLAAVRTGSHFDTTLNAGRYDGVVGVLAAIEAVGALRDRGLRRAIDVIGFAGEEPRFGTGCIGSRAVMGDLSRADLDRLVDRNGVSLAQALSGAGFDPEDIDAAAWDAASVHAFVELHIEQGIVLESAGEQIGVVTAIAAPHDLRVTLQGAATHAGATPMGLRRDALAGAAEAMVELEKLAVGSPSGTTVGTVGVMRVRPGAINIVPGEVELDVDVRDSDLAAREHTIDEFLAATAEIAERRNLELEVTPIVEDTPAPCAPLVVDAAVGACEELGLEFRRMISGAYHDAMVLAAEVPIGMLFVPSARGISHHPDEHTDAADIDRGVDVLAGTLARLAS